MTDPKEFNSLDELFRKTFEDLPETPASSGWDTPSPQIWDQVQVRLKPPRSGWSTNTIILVSGFAIVLMLGLYWALTRTNQTEAPTSAPTATETPLAAPNVNAGTPASPVTAPATTPSVTSSESRASNPAPVHRTKRQPSHLNPVTALEAPNPGNTTEQIADEPRPHRPIGSAPLPGSRPASPNTTVLRQETAWQNKPWSKPLSPLPSVLDIPVIRPVPAELKNISKPKH